MLEFLWSGASKSKRPGAPERRAAARRDELGRADNAQPPEAAVPDEQGLEKNALLRESNASRKSSKPKFLKRQALKRCSLNQSPTSTSKMKQSSAGQQVQRHCGARHHRTWGWLQQDPRRGWRVGAVVGG
jgi:hypothetical protein